MRAPDPESTRETHLNIAAKYLSSISSHSQLFIMWGVRDLHFLQES